MIISILNLPYTNPTPLSRTPNLQKQPYLYPYLDLYLYLYLHPRSPLKEPFQSPSALFENWVEEDASQVELTAEERRLAVMRAMVTGILEGSFKGDMDIDLLVDVDVDIDVEVDVDIDSYVGCLKGVSESQFRYFLMV